MPEPKQHTLEDDELFLVSFIMLALEGFKARVATYIERIQFRREAPWTRSARTARVSI